MAEEYIYLRDYIKILWKRKWTVILVLIISVMTTVVVVFGFQKKNCQPQQNHENIITIQNGVIYSSSIAKAESFEIIKMFAGDIANKIQFEDIPNTQLFRIKLKNEDSDILLQIAKRYVDERMESYAAKYKVYLQNKENLIKQKQILENILSDLQDAVIELSNIKSKDLTEFQRFNSLNCYKGRILETKDKIIQKEIEINGIDNIMSDSKQYLVVSLSKNCDSVVENKISKKYKILLSAIFGLLGGIMLVFTVENWNKSQ